MLRSIMMMRMPFRGSMARHAVGRAGAMQLKPKSGSPLRAKSSSNRCAHPLTEPNLLRYRVIRADVWNMAALTSISQTHSGHAEHCDLVSQPEPVWPCICSRSGYLACSLPPEIWCQTSFCETQSFSLSTLCAGCSGSAEWQGVEVLP